VFPCLAGRRLLPPLRDGHIDVGAFAIGHGVSVPVPPVPGRFPRGGAEEPPMNPSSTSSSATL
jgi:hypothetical protein